jgi:hypothetical protein
MALQLRSVLPELSLLRDRLTHAEHVGVGREELLRRRDDKVAELDDKVAELTAAGVVAGVERQELVRELARAGTAAAAVAAGG